MPRRVAFRRDAQKILPCRAPAAGRADDPAVARHRADGIAAAPAILVFVGEPRAADRARAAGSPAWERPGRPWRPGRFRSMPSPALAGRARRPSLRRGLEARLAPVLVGLLAPLPLDLLLE